MAVLYGSGFALDGFGDGGFLFLGEREAAFQARDHRFRVEARTLARVQGGNHQARILAIEECDAKALIAAHFFEGIEAEDTRLVDAFHPELAQSVGNFKQLLDFSVELLGFGQLIEEDLLQVFGFRPREKDVQFLLQTAILCPQENDNHREKNFTEKKGAEAPIHDG